MTDTGYMTTTLEIDSNGIETVDVKFTKRTYGGWIVRRADNNRPLGWLTRDETGWEARLDSSAFRGTGKDDLGDVLDDVPGWLHNGEANGLVSRSIGTFPNREEAAWEICWRLIRNEAPAMGFGPHYAVKTWRR